jgi:hypothetical protein
MSSGGYSLWSVPGVSYLQVVDTIAPLSLNRGDIGSQTAWWLHSPLPTEDLYPTVAYEGAAAAVPTVTGRTEPAGPAGSVTAEHADLSDGRLSATVHANRTAVVVLSASYDPGWSATVDGKASPIEMIAPALVGIRIGPGVHTVIFTYRSQGDGPWLFALSGLSLAAVIIGCETARRRRRVPSGVRTNRTRR